jgi:hypothetical protein
MDVLFVNAGVATFAPLSGTSESLYSSYIPSIDLQVDGELAQV